jgi:hypothetical protein
MFLRPNWQEMESGVCARATFARAVAAMRRTGTIRNRRFSQDFHRVPPMQATHSFRFDVRFLDDRPPLLDLSLLIGRERFRRLLLERKNLLPDIGEP